MMNQLIRTTTKKYIKNISKQIANKPRYFASAEVGERPEPNVCDSLLQIGSRRIYSQEHDMYREMLRNFYKDSKKVDNKKMKTFFKYNLKFPTYVEGLEYIFNNNL